MIRHSYEFGPFQLHPDDRLLTRDRAPVALPPRAFDTLLVLIRQNGHLVTKTDLISAVWPDSFVEESNLTVAISVLRKALGDDDPKRRYVETVSKAGYRFVGQVRERQSVDESGEKAAIETAAAHGTGVAVSPWLVRISLALLLLAASGAAMLLVRQKSLAGRGSIRSLAVLPFRSLHPQSGRDYLAAGMTDALITKLSSGGSVIIRPTSAVLKYAGGADPLAAGREQGVDAILDGRIQDSPDRVRVTVQLVRVADGASLWAGTFEQPPQQVFKLEDSMAENISASLTSGLTGEEKKRLTRNQTVNAKAYELYMRGRYFWNRRTEDSLRRSIEYFQQAIAQDPDYALAYAGLADTYALLASFSVQPGQQAHSNAKAAALKAIQLDPTLAEPHASLGMISFFSDWDGAAAEQEFQRSIALQPNYATAHHWYALDLAAMGRFPEALSEAERAEQLDPLSLIIVTNVGWVLYLSHQYDRAVGELQKALELDPAFARTRTRLGITYLGKNQTQAAIGELEQALRLSGQDPYIAGVLGDAQARAGDQAGARRILKELNDRAKTHYVPPFSFALVYLGLGERDEAMRWLLKAYDDRSTSMVYAKIDPILDSIRTDSRFVQILRRMKF